MFNLKFPDIETEELPRSGNLRTEKVENLIFKTVVGVKSFCPVTFFAEQGPYTGHIYQPKVNHRVVDFMSYSHRQEASALSKPLRESMIYPNEETGFSVGNLMGLYCYEVTKLDTHPVGIRGVLESPATLNHTFEVNGMGEILKVKAEPLTISTFRRLLAVFGLQRHKAYNNIEKVDVKEIADFFEKICSHNIGTKEGLAAFLKEFHLDRFYHLK